MSTPTTPTGSNSIPAGSNPPEQSNPIPVEFRTRIRYEPKYKVLICLDCGIAISGERKEGDVNVTTSTKHPLKSFSQHLRRHNWTKLQALLDAVLPLDPLPVATKDFPRPPDGEKI